MAKRGSKSAKWHELKRCERLRDHLQRCLDTGRYAGDHVRASRFITEYTNKVERLELEVAQEAT